MGRFFTEKITVHIRKKGIKNQTYLTRPTFIHEGIKAIEVVFVCTSRYSYRHNSSIHVTPKTWVLKVCQKHIQKDPYKIMFDPNWHELWNQEKCLFLASPRCNFLKKQWACHECQISLISVNFHFLKSLEIYDKKSADNSDPIGQGVESTLPHTN